MILMENITDMLMKQSTISCNSEKTFETVKSVICENHITVIDLTIINKPTMHVRI